VEVCTRQASFSDLDGEALRGHEVMLGADICFWDELTQPLLELVERALQAGIQQIVLADPGRPPFHALSDRCVARLGAETKSWELDEPVRVRAELLIVGTLPVAGG